MKGLYPVNMFNNTKLYVHKILTFTKKPLKYNRYNYFKYLFPTFFLFFISITSNFDLATDSFKE